MIMLYAGTVLYCIFSKHICDVSSANALISNSDLMYKG